MCIGLTVRLPLISHGPSTKTGLENGENKEFWLGNENVYQLVKSWQKRMARLSFGLKEPSLSELVDDFRLENETDRYRLRFGKTFDNAGGRIIYIWLT